MRLLVPSVLVVVAWAAGVPAGPRVRRGGEIGTCATATEFQSRRSAAYRCKARLIAAGYTSKAKFNYCASLACELDIPEPGLASRDTATKALVAASTFLALRIQSVPLLITIVICMASSSQALRREDLDASLEREKEEVRLDMMEKRLEGFNQTLLDMMEERMQGFNHTLWKFVDLEKQLEAKVSGDVTETDSKTEMFLEADSKTEMFLEADNKTGIVLEAGTKTGMVLEADNTTGMVLEADKKMEETMEGRATRFSILALATCCLLTSFILIWKLKDIKRAVVRAILTTSQMNLHVMPNPLAQYNDVF